MGLNGYKDNGCSEEVYSKKEIDDKFKNLNLDVDLSGIEKQVNSAVSTANSAQSTANSAKTTANNAESKANTNATSITNIQTKNVATPTMTNGSSSMFYTVTKKNNTVNYYIELQNYLSANQTKKVATLPSGYRPSGTTKGVAFMDNDGYFQCTPVIVYSDGTMEVTNGGVDMKHIIMQGAFDI